jgi:hypothetical protein
MNLETAVNAVTEPQHGGNLYAHREHGQEWVVCNHDRQDEPKPKGGRTMQAAPYNVAPKDRRGVAFGWEPLARRHQHPKSRVASSCNCRPTGLRVLIATKGETTMDPDEALRNAREAVRRLNADEFEVDSGDAMALVEAFEALDGWLSEGGFLPAAWKR